MMLNGILIAALITLGLTMLACLYRAVKGPSTADRVIALDAIGIQLISMTAVLSMLLQTSAFVDIILLIGILSFIGTITFSKYIERGAVFERERDR